MARNTKVATKSTKRTVLKRKAGPPREPYLIPPDYKRCQAEKQTTVFTFGPRQQWRCSNEPDVIATEIQSQRADGKKGSMSLCLHCLVVANNMLDPVAFRLMLITKKRGVAPGSSANWGEPT